MQHVNEILNLYTSSSNSRIASPIELFGTRAPRTSKNESSAITRSARRLASFNGVSLNAGADDSRIGLNNELGFGESNRSDAKGLSHIQNQYIPQNEERK